MRLPGLVFLFCTIVSVPPASPGAEAPLRRVVLISCDTLSASHLQTYGYDRDTASVVDSLAAEGVVFRHCLVPQVWTLSSHMSLMTGLAPGVHRVGMETAVPKTVPLMAERLHAAGFATGAFITSNFWMAPSFGFDRGFDLYRIHSLHKPLGQLARRWLDETAPVVDRAAAAPPFCLFVHYMDVHTRDTSSAFPYKPFRIDCWPDQLMSAGTSRRRLQPLPTDDPFHAQGVKQWNLAAYPLGFLRDSYDVSIKCWDGWRLHSLLAELRESGHLRDTLIVLTADHGEEFQEHGRFLHRSPHIEVREVPLIMVWPGHLPAGAVVEQRVSLMDVAPTLLDLADIEALPDGQGRSLRPLLDNPSASGTERDFLIDGDHRGYRQEDTGLVAQVKGRWWLLVARCDTTGTTDTFRPATVDRVIGLYDLDADPEEWNDLIEARPGVVDELRRRLENKLNVEAALAEEVHSAATSIGVELTEEQRRALKALGY